MKQVKILGTGCPKCEQLAKATEAALAEIGEPYEMEKVTKIEEIIGYGVMMTPALVVDGEVRVAGKVPNPGDLKALLA